MLQPPSTFPGGHLDDPTTCELEPEVAIGTGRDHRRYSALATEYGDPPVKADSGDDPLANPVNQRPQTDVHAERCRYPPQRETW